MLTVTSAHLAFFSMSINYLSCSIARDLPVWKNQHSSAKMKISSSFLAYINPQITTDSFIVELVEKDVLGI